MHNKRIYLCFNVLTYISAFHISDQHTEFLVDACNASLSSIRFSFHVKKTYDQIFDLHSFFFSHHTQLLIGDFISVHATFVTSVVQLSCY